MGYFDIQTGEMVAKVHQYICPDDSLGGSGQPDPKWLFEEGVIYGLATNS